MSRPLTASDRASLIRLASSLPAGSAERKAILAGLGQTKQASEEINVPGKHVFDRAEVFDGAKVFGKAKVSGDAQVYGDAVVFDKAKVFERAEVYGNAKVFDRAKVSGNAKVFDRAEVSGKTEVYGNAKVSGNAAVKERALAFEDARVFNKALLYGDARVQGNAEIFGNAEVYGKAQVYENSKVFDEAHVYGYAEVSGNAQVFGEAHVYLFAKVSGDAKVCGEARIGGHAEILGGFWDGSEGRVLSGKWLAPGVPASSAAERKALLAGLRSAGSKIVMHKDKEGNVHALSLVDAVEYDGTPSSVVHRDGTPIGKVFFKEETRRVAPRGSTLTTHSKSLHPWNYEIFDASGRPAANYRAKGRGRSRSVAFEAILEGV